jgi:hypothetical protein
MVIFRNWHLEISKHGQVEEGKSAITFVTTNSICHDFSHKFCNSDSGERKEVGERKCRAQVAQVSAQGRKCRAQEEGRRVSPGKLVFAASCPCARKSRRKMRGPASKLPWLGKIFFIWNLQSQRKFSRIPWIGGFSAESRLWVDPSFFLQFNQYSRLDEFWMFCQK